MNSRQLYHRLLNEFRPYLWIGFFTLFAVGLAAATDVLLIRQLQTVIDALAPSHVVGAVRPPATGMLAVAQQWLTDILPKNTADAAMWSIPLSLIHI